MLIENLEGNLILKEQNFLFIKKTMQKYKNNITFLLVCLIFFSIKLLKTFYKPTVTSKTV